MLLLRFGGLFPCCCSSDLFALLACCSALFGDQAGGANLHNKMRPLSQPFRWNCLHGHNALASTNSHRFDTTGTSNKLFAPLTLCLWVVMQMVRSGPACPLSAGVCCEGLTQCQRHGSAMGCYVSAVGFRPRQINSPRLP